MDSSGPLVHGASENSMPRCCQSQGYPPLCPLFTGPFGRVIHLTARDSVCFRHRAAPAAHFLPAARDRTVLQNIRVVWFVWLAHDHPRTRPRRSSVPPVQAFLVTCFWVHRQLVSPPWRRPGSSSANEMDSHIPHCDTKRCCQCCRPGGDPPQH